MFFVFSLLFVFLLFVLRMAENFHVEETTDETVEKKGVL